MKQSKPKQTGEAMPPATISPILQGVDAQRSRESRNRANTIRNSVKVEHYLMEVEKVHGFAKAWALRERLEHGSISFDELLRR